MLLQQASIIPNLPLTDSWANLAIAAFTILGVLINSVFVILVFLQIRQTNRIIEQNKEQIKRSQDQIRVSQDQLKISQEQTQAMKDELGITKEEIDSRLRPFLGFTIPVVTIKQDKSFISNEITNYGSYPATNVNIRCENDISIINVNKRAYYNVPSIILMPNQSHSGQIMINGNIDDHVNKGNKIFLLLSVTYENNRINKNYMTNVLYEYKKDLKFVMIDSYFLN